MSIQNITHYESELPIQSGRIVKPREVVNREHEKTYARFFAIAAIGFVISGIQGIIQRLPSVADWIYAAGYGGHLISNLGQTHISMVGAGTLTVTALMYYVLPRILNRPIYSHTLTQWAFWMTFLGVYGFYVVMTINGVILGNAVVHGIDYDVARRSLGAWYDAPVGIVSALMGFGYWVFVANIYLTMRGPRGWKREEGYIAKYIFTGTTGLFIGTLQGFFQVMPYAVNFIRDTGEAGREIDPLAHAHINMVGGMLMALMGLSFFIIPRLTGKPIWNPKLTRISYWFVTIGVFGFWISLITLGIIEGNMILDLRMHANNISVDQAYDMAVGMVGPWHDALRAGFGTIMGIGIWLYITVIYRTFMSKASSKVPAFPQELIVGDVPSPAPEKEMRFQSYFFLASITAMLIGSIQGVIQILPFAEEWLDSAGQAGDLIAPLAHAQMNIVASIGFGLMGLVYFAFPRVTGRQWASPPLLRLTFVLMVTGMALYYISLITLGLIESDRMHALTQGPDPMTQLAAFNQVRQEIGWAHPFWLTFSNVFIAAGYIVHIIHVWVSLGSQSVRDGFANWIIEVAGILDRAIAIGQRHKVRDYALLRWYTIRSFFVELFAGLLGCMGLGWVLTGRSALGFGMMFTWFTGWLVYVEWMLTNQTRDAGDFGFIFMMLPLYVAGPVISASLSALTYYRFGLKRKAVHTPSHVIIESSAILIEDAQISQS
jgi:cbb3-type cytochrome oxidase subunit 1